MRSVIGCAWNHNGRRQVCATRVPIGPRWFNRIARADHIRHQSRVSRLGDSASDLLAWIGKDRPPITRVCRIGMVNGVTRLRLLRSAHEPILAQPLRG